jgi:hypothetical protein
MKNILKCGTFLLLNRKDQDWQTAQGQISFTKQSQHLMERRDEKAGMD